MNPRSKLAGAGAATLLLFSLTGCGGKGSAASTATGAAAAPARTTTPAVTATHTTTTTNATSTSAATTTSGGATGSKTCPGGDVAGVIGGKGKCLHAGQECSAKNATDYGQYRFTCAQQGQKYILAKK